MAGQNIAMWKNKQKYKEKDGRLMETLRANREARCKVTSQEPQDRSP